MDYPSVPVVPFPQAADCIQSGDILFVSGNSSIDNLIKFGTNSVWSHIGLLFNVKDTIVSRVMMMESLITTGVRTVPLSSYVYNYNGTSKPFNGKIMVGRYHNFPTDKLNLVADKAIDLLGYPYSSDDIANIAARIALSSTTGIKLSTSVGSDKSYICSEYVAVCYKAADITLPYNVDGYIAPNDIALCNAITPLFFIGE